MKPNKVGISLYNAYAYGLFGSLTDMPFYRSLLLQKACYRTPPLENPLAMDFTQGAVAKPRCVPRSLSAETFMLLNNRFTGFT